jgi:inositol-phosphate phosphatase/L-galactose 1-phosphate phosphatase/histidinol-phosphatase
MASSSPPHQLHDFANVANKAADAAGDVIRQYFRKNFDIIHKQDLSN